MSDDLVTKLLPAMDIAAFKRAPDGSFRADCAAAAMVRSARRRHDVPVSRPYPRGGDDVLAEVRPGSREWGPCVEENEVGREFHYRVLAVTAEAGQFLVFQLDSGADRMREVLQKVRRAGAGRSRRPALKPGSPEFSTWCGGRATGCTNCCGRCWPAACGMPQFELWKKLSARLRRSEQHRRRSGLRRRGRSRVEGSVSLRPPHAIRDPSGTRSPTAALRRRSASPRAVRVHLLRGRLHRPRQHRIRRDGAAARPAPQPDGQYGFGAGLFFLAYCLFEIPSNLILERVGARRWIARILIGWGDGVDGDHVRHGCLVVHGRACPARDRRGRLLPRDGAVPDVLDSRERARPDGRAVHDGRRLSPSSSAGRCPKRCSRSTGASDSRDGNGCSWSKVCRRSCSGCWRSSS